MVPIYEVNFALAMGLVPWDSGTQFYRCFQSVFQSPVTFRAILSSEAFQTNAQVRPSDIVACSIVTPRNEVGAR